MVYVHRLLLWSRPVPRDFSRSGGGKPRRVWREFYAGIVPSLSRIHKPYGNKPLLPVSFVKALHGGKLHRLMTRHLDSRTVASVHRQQHAGQPGPGSNFRASESKFAVSVLDQEPAAHPDHENTGQSPA